MLLAISFAGKGEFLAIDGNAEVVDGLQLIPQDVECTEEGQGVALAEVVSLVEEVLHGVADGVDRRAELVDGGELADLLRESLVEIVYCNHNGQS